MSDHDEQADAGRQERDLHAAEGDQRARAEEGGRERERGAGLLEREQAPVQRLGDRVREQQPVVDEREAVAEAAEHEHRQQQPERRQRPRTRAGRTPCSRARSGRPGATPTCALKRAASEPSTVPTPPAVISVARPEPPTSRTSRGEHDLADVGHADAQHGGGRAPEQRADLRAAGAASRMPARASANSDGLLLAAPGRRPPPVPGMPAITHRAEREATRR